MVFNIYFENMYVVNPVCIILCFLCSACAVESARVLGIFYIPSKSHHILGQALFKALTKRGHQVTMMSPFSIGQTVENYTEVVLDEILDYKEEYMQDIIRPDNASKVSRMYDKIRQYTNVTHLFWKSKPVQEFIESSQKYDLIISISALNAFALALGHKWNAPVILLSTIGSHIFTNKHTGNPTPFSYVPVLINSMDETSFLDRLLNTVSGIGYELATVCLSSDESEFVKKHFPDAPPLKELHTGVDLILLNSHYSVESVRPYLPNMVQIGGFHIGELKALPNVIQSFLDSAKDGAVFFSLGSNVKLSKLPEDKKGVIVRTLGKLKEKVLMTSDEEFENLPQNIKAGKWFPQNDILGHPNIKAFISHGGLLSTLEAVHHGVPIVGLPCFSDQESNMVTTEKSGYAIKLDILSVDEDILYRTIREIIDDKKYRNNVQKASQLFRERPVKPMDTAIFWIEHVIKHQGAAHLRSPRLNLRWYQHLLLDVLAFIAALLICLLVLIYTIFKILIKRCLRSKTKKSKVP